MFRKSSNPDTSTGTSQRGRTSETPPPRQSGSKVTEQPVVRPAEINWAPKPQEPQAPRKPTTKSHKPTRGLIRRPPLAGAARGPASLSARHLKTDNWDQLLTLLQPIIDRGTVPLTVTDKSIEAVQCLSLTQPDLKDWQKMIETLVLHGEADAARRLLAMCTDTTLFALLTDLSPHCLGAMAANDHFVDRKLFIDLLYGTATKAADARRFALVSRLLTYLPPKERAQLILKFPDATPVPATSVVGKPSLELARGDIDDETWFMISLALEETVAEQQRRQADADPPPMLSITPQTISTARPQIASYKQTKGFSQAIGALLNAKQSAKACELLLMCSPRARAFVLRELMAPSGQAGSCFDQLVSVDAPEVRTMLEQAIAGCLDDVSSISGKDAQALDETLKRLQACQKSWADAKASQAIRFWRAYGACSSTEQAKLDKAVPSHWLGLKTDSLDLAARAARLTEQITTAFGKGPDAGLLACEQAMQACDQWKDDRQWGLLVRGIVAQALSLRADTAWTPEQGGRKAAVDEWSWIGPLTSRDLRGVSAVPDVCDMLLQAAVEQAANADAPAERRNYVQGLVRLCRQLHTGDTPMERHLAWRLNGYLRQGLGELLKIVPSDDRPFFGEQLHQLPLLIDDLIRAAGDVSNLAQRGQEGAANEYLDLVERALIEEMKACGLAWDLNGWKSSAGDSDAIRMGQRQAAQRALVVLKLCSNADKRPLLPALERWLTHEALPLDQCDLATQHAIKAFDVEALERNREQRVWSEACGAFVRTQEWMRDLVRLSQPLPKAELQAILSRLDSEAFAQWLHAVRQSGEPQRAALEEALAQVLGSEHFNAHLGAAMAKVFGQPSGPRLPDPSVLFDLQPVRAPEASLMEAALARLILSPGCDAPMLKRVLTAMATRIYLLSVLTCPVLQPGRPEPSGIDRLLRLSEILSKDTVVMDSLSSLREDWSVAWQTALHLGELMAGHPAEAGEYKFGEQEMSTLVELPAFSDGKWRLKQLLFEPLWQHAMVNGLKCPPAFNAWYVAHQWVSGHIILNLPQPIQAEWMLHWIRASPGAAGESAHQQLGAVRVHLTLAWCEAYWFMKPVHLRLRPAFANVLREARDPVARASAATAMVAAFELFVRSRLGGGGDAKRFRDRTFLQELADGWQVVLHSDTHWLSSLPEDSQEWVQAFAATGNTDNVGDEARFALMARLLNQWPALPPDSEAWRERFAQYARSAGKGG